MKRSLLILLIILTALQSCTVKNTEPREIILRLCEAEAGLPSGQIYSTDADEGSPHHLRPELLTVTYGIPIDFDGIESGAVWLSGVRHPVEFAVFLCKNANSAEDISVFFNQRIKNLQKNAYLSAPLCDMSVENYKEYLSGASVTVSGRYVALIISSDPHNARRAFLKGV